MWWKKEKEEEEEEEEEEKENLFFGSNVLRNPKAYKQINLILIHLSIFFDGFLMKSKTTWICTYVCTYFLKRNKNSLVLHVNIKIE